MVCYFQFPNGFSLIKYKAPNVELVSVFQFPNGFSRKITLSSSKECNSFQFPNGFSQDMAILHRG